MDIRRLKTIFIFVLAFVNLILGIMLYNVEVREKEIAISTRENVELLLKRDMIYLAPKLKIPEAPEIRDFYLERMAANNEEFAAKVLGGRYTTNDAGVYSNGERSLTIGGDEFVYKNPTPQNVIENFTIKEIENSCRREMKALGIKSELYVFGGVNQIENGVRAIFTAQHHEDAFFDAYISFDISKNGIYSISGKNLISNMTMSSGNKQFLNVSSILLEIAKTPDFNKNKQTTIVSIKTGYCIGKSAESFRNILAIPVWQIATDSGDIMYFDARNGDYIADM